MNVNEIYDFVICVFRTIASLQLRVVMADSSLDHKDFCVCARVPADATRVRGHTTTLVGVPYNFVIRYRVLSRELRTFFGGAPVQIISKDRRRKLGLEVMGGWVIRGH